MGGSKFYYLKKRRKCPRILLFNDRLRIELVKVDNYLKTVYQLLMVLQVSKLSNVSVTLSTSYCTCIGRRKTNQSWSCQIVDGVLDYIIIGSILGGAVIGFMENIVEDRSALDVTNDNALLIRVKVQSRHKSQAKYWTYVLVDKSRDGLDAVRGHYCSCPVGARTVGCCSHCAFVIWYFGYARHQATVGQPGQALLQIFAPSEISEDEEEGPAQPEEGSGTTVQEVFD